MIPSWLVIAVITLAVPLTINRFISSKDFYWFKRLRRPKWITFESAIPMIWTIIFICGAWSAYHIWEVNPGSFSTWILMFFYLILEIAISLYILATGSLSTLEPSRNFCDLANDKT